MWMGQLTCLTKEIIMTNLEVFNNLSKQLFNGSTKFFDDSFESIFDTWSKVQSFPFYNVVKYSKGKYGLEIGLAGYNKENVLVEVKDGILTVEGKVDDTFEAGLQVRKIKPGETDVYIKPKKSIPEILKDFSYKNTTIAIYKPSSVRRIRWD